MHELKGAEAAEKKLLEKMKQFICSTSLPLSSLLQNVLTVS